METDKWIAALPAETIERELDEMRNQRYVVEQKIQMLELALSLATMGAAKEKGSQPQENRRPPGIGSMSQPLRGREAIRRVIAATPEKDTWTIPEMLKAILDRGWAANSHAVQVNLSRMFRDGELTKAGTGIYCVPAKRRKLLASSQEAQE
jgi:hypothetical protein